MPDFQSPFVRLARWLQVRRSRRADNRALRVAMGRFSHLHPHWYDSMFDEALLDKLSTVDLQELGAEGLAREWSRQFRYQDERRRDLDVRRLTPVASSFLGLVHHAKAEAARRAPVDRETMAESASRHHGDEKSRSATPKGVGARSESSSCT